MSGGNQINHFTLLTPEESDTGTLTTSSETSTALAINLQNLQPTKTWRTTTLTGLNLVLDFGQPEPVNQVFLGYHNGTADGTVRVRGASTQASLTTNPGFDSGPLSLFTQLDGLTAAWNEELSDPAFDALDRNHFFLHLLTSEVFRFWRLDIFDPTNSNGVFEAGRLIVGEAWQPASTNVTWPIGMGFMDSSIARKTASGVTFVNRKQKRRMFNARITHVDQAEFQDNLEEINRKRAGSDDVLLVLRPNQVPRRHKDMFYGLMKSETSTIQLSSFSKTRWLHRITVNELI